MFDLDNTLIDRAASFLRWASQIAAVHALGPDDVTWLVKADGDGFVRDRVADDIPAAVDALSSPPPS